MAKRPGWVLAKGTPVSWGYRKTRGYGYIESVVKLGSDQAHTEYAIRQVDHHVSDSGSREPATVNHYGSDIRREKRSTVESHAHAAKDLTAWLDDIEERLVRLGG